MSRRWRISEWAIGGAGWSERSASPARAPRAGVASRVILGGVFVGCLLLYSGCAFIPDTAVSPPSSLPPPKIEVISSGTTVIAKEQLGPIKNMVAVVVGVSKYKHAGEGTPKLKDLNYAAADADALSAHFYESGFNKVIVLTDEKATCAEVRKQIHDNVGVAGESDFVVVFWAGHGSSDRKNRLYLLTYDADPDDLARTAYPMDEFCKDVSGTSSRRLMVMIDTCHSGGVTDPTLASRDAGGSDVKEAMRGVFLAEPSPEPASAPAKNATMRLLFTACETNEVSLESSEHGHGVFTYFLLKALQGEADKNHEGKVTLDEVIEYTRENVRVFSGSRQNPSAAGQFDRTITLGVARKGTDAAKGK